jgi:hypothetical protein
VSGVLNRIWLADIERHEAFANPAMVEGHG